MTAGTKLEVAHFEQLHDLLDETKTVVENVTDGSEMISVGGGERHVVGYLRDFLFTPEQIQGSISKLSGGERRRLQLARILAQPCNLLVLDEPTNDLDLETLEMLEDLLVEYQGTLLVVSHDRTFLDNVVTSTIVFEGVGQVARIRGRLRGLVSPEEVCRGAPLRRDRSRRGRNHQGASSACHLQ